MFGGNQWRPHVHVRDVGRAIVSVLNAPLITVRSRIFNVGSTEQNHTIDELSELAKQVFPDLEVVRKNAESDPRNYRVNCDRIREVLGFDTEISVLEGMEELKRAIETGELGDPDQAHYSNFQTIQNLAIK